MKFLVILPLVLAVAASYPLVKTWTLLELSEALEKSKVDASQRPYLEEALNEIMLALFTGKNEKFIHAVLPSPVGEPSWTLPELIKAVKDPATKPEHRPALVQAYHYVMNKNATGELEDKVEVAIPALDISTWTPADLNEALNDPNTKPELLPYLEKARSEFKTALSAGENRETISMVTPVGLVESKQDFVLMPKIPKRFFKKYMKGL